MNQEEKRVITAHNERVKRDNPQPEPIPEAPDDIQSVIDAYNEAERLQYERLGAIYAYCMQYRKRAVNFVGGGYRWTNFPYDAERPDIGLDRYVNPFIVYIESIE